MRCQVPPPLLRKPSLPLLLPPRAQSASSPQSAPVRTPQKQKLALTSTWTEPKRTRTDALARPVLVLKGSGIVLIGGPYRGYLCTMTSPQKKNPVKEEDVKSPPGRDARRRSVHTIAVGSMANTSYRQLQFLAKLCGVPCNIKKDILKMILKAKMNGNNEDADELLKYVRETRLLRKKAKAIGNSNARSICGPKEEKNNRAAMSENQISGKGLGQSKVKELLHSMLKIQSTSNVTIEQTSVSAQYKAVINPGHLKLNKCLARAPPRLIPVTTHGNRKHRLHTVTHGENHPTTASNYSKLSTTSLLPVMSTQNDELSHRPVTHREDHSTTASQRIPVRISSIPVRISSIPASNNSKVPPTSFLPVMTTQTYGHDHPPNTAFSVVDQRNPVYQNSAQRFINSNHNYFAQRFDDSNSLSGAASCHHYNNVSTSFQPIENFQQQVQLYSHKNQLVNNDTQTNEMCHYHSPPLLNSYQAEQQNYRLYGGYENGIQTPTTFYNAENFMRGQNHSRVSVTNTETAFEMQPAYPIHNRPFTNTGFYQENSSFSGAFPAYEAKERIDMTYPPADNEAINTDLGMLANMAMTKTYNETSSHQSHNNLLMVDSHCSNSSNNDDLNLSSPDKPLTQNSQAWNNLLKEMSTSLSPSLFTVKPTIICKYGCNHVSTNQSEHLDHEQNCLKQPMQCPIMSCNFVTQLGSLSTHIFNMHNKDVKSNLDGNFSLDFTGERCSFEQGRSLLQNCPKKLRFCQLVDGRLFIISVLGNFDSMQVVVYIQYVNDYFSYKSYAVCEIVRPDGLPIQYTGEAYPLTFNPVHIITRKKCLVFNMNPCKLSDNLFILHTKIVNHMF